MTKLAMDRSTSVQKLKDADCPPLLAEAIVDVVSISRAEIATKGDFESMKEDFHRLEDAIKEQKEDIKEQREDIKEQKEDIKELREDINEQRKEITRLDGKVNKLSYEFQGLRKDFKRVDEKAELRWKIQQAESQFLIAKIEAYDTKLDTKLETFESKFSAFQNKVLLSVVGGILLAVAIVRALAYIGAI